MIPALEYALSHEGTLQKWSGLASRVAELIPVNRLTDNLTSLDNFIETDTTGKVNIVAGGLEMDGNNALNQTGVQYSVGLSRKISKLSLSFTLGNSINQGHGFFVKNSSGLPTSAISVNQFLVYYYNNGGVYLFEGNSTNTGIRIGTFLQSQSYTINIYIYKSNDNTWSKIIVTLFGGEYTTETIVYLSDKIQTEIASIWYAGFYRFLSAESNKIIFSRFTIDYDYDTAGTAYLWGKADAGAGKKFVNFDPTKIGVPTGLSTAYNTVYYELSDSATPTIGTKYTYAQLASRPKVTGEGRYLHIIVQQNSDGVVQPYAGIVLNTGAVDGINFEYCKFVANKNVGSIDGGTVVRLTFDNPIAALVSSVTINGENAAITPVDANNIDITTPANGAGIYNIVANITGYTAYTVVNGFTYNDDSPPPGPDTIMGMLIKLHKAFYGTGKIEESPEGSGRFYLVLYDNDGSETDTVIAKCELKGYGGAAVASFIGNTSPCVRLKSMIDVVPTIPESATVLGILEKMINYEFGKKIQKEIPVGSGKFFEVTYDSAGTEIGRCALKAYGGAEIASPEGSTEPVERLRSTV